jgi:type I restriction enzyme, S subunit
MLPEGWRMVRFDEVVTRTSKRCTPVISPELRWIGADHLDEGDLRVNRWSTTDDPMFPPTFYFAVPAGSVLVHSRNPKKVAVLPFDVITGEKFFCLRAVDTSLLDERFLAYQLQSDHFHEFVSRWISGSVNKFLNWTALARYEFALPPIDEQERIVEVITACDESLNAYRLVQEAAESARRAVFESATQGADVVPLGELCEVDLGRQRAPRFASGSNMVPYIRAANVKHRRLEIDDVLEMNFTPEEQSRFDLREGDVLVTEGCGSLAEIGANLVWRMEIQPPVCFQNTILRLRARTDRIEPGYLAAWCDAAFLGGRFSAIATGTSIFHLGAKRTAAMEVPLLSLDRQANLVAEIDKLTEVGSVVSQAQADLRMVRHLLLNGALRSGADDVH